MASFRLMHRATGVVLTGYVVLSASQAEIDHANRNLRESGSGYRYVEALALPDLHSTDAELVQAG